MIFGYSKSRVPSQVSPFCSFLEELTPRFDFKRFMSCSTLNAKDAQKDAQEADELKEAEEVIVPINDYGSCFC